MPPIRDMARIKFGGSRCQIAGVQVPVADFDLRGSEEIYFSHHHLLWCDPSVELTPKPMAGGWNRIYAGVPLVMLQAGGPGRLALSHDSPGEVIAVPLERGSDVVVAEHRFLAATANVDYSWKRTYLSFQTQKGEDLEQQYPLGRYRDVFRADGGPGLLLLYAPGNTFVRELRQGESVFVRPTALVYTDTSVTTWLHFEFPKGATEMYTNPGVYLRPGMAHLLYFVWLRLQGPGRVAVQSVFRRPEGTGPPVRFQGGGNTAVAW